MAIIGVPDPGASGSRSRPPVARRRIVSVTNNENTAIRKHSRFWDRKNKGYITPIDTAAGFMNLGYGVVFSLTIGTFMGIFLAYATQDSWIPDPRCRINVRKLTSPAKRHSNSRVYDEYGQFDPERFESLFDKYAQSDLSGSTITLTELLQLAGEQGSYGASPTAWTTALFEFIGLYMMIGKGGTFKKSDIRAVYDGSLFYRIRETKRPIIQAAAIDTSSGHLLTQNAIRAFERHLNTAVEHLPEATVSMVRSFVPVESILGGNVVTTPVQLRRPFVAERISGTKTVSLDNQSFSLTGVQGYTSAPSVSSEEDLDVPDLVSVQSDSSDSLAELSALTGLRPDGADFYRDTPLTNWIGSQLSGVQKATTDGIPVAENDETKYYGVPLAGVKNKRNAPLTDWLVEDHESDTKKPVVELQPVTLTGIARSSETAADASSSSDDNNKKVRFDLESVTLNGVQHDDTQNKMQGVPIVQAPSRVDKDLNFDLEPVTLSGLRQDDIIPQKENKGLAIVNAPTLFDFEEVDFESYKQPVSLTGLVSQKVSDERGPFPVVEAPSGLFKREKDLHVVPVALTGVRQADEMINKDEKRSIIPMVNTPVSFEPEDTLFTGSNIATLTGIPADAEHELSLPVNKFEPTLLTGLRPVDAAPASFVEAPADYERKETVTLEPTSLSGLRSVDTTTPATFVEAPTSFAPKEPATLEPVSLSGLRSVNTTPASFVEAPTSFAPKEPATLEPVLLSGLRSVDTASATFVEAPTSFEPKAPVMLEPMSLSGLRPMDTEPVKFVEAPTVYERKTAVALEPMSLSGLRYVDTASATFAEAPASIERNQVVTLEPISLSGLRSMDTEPTSFVEAPADFEPKEPATLEPMSLSGLRSVDIEPASFVEAPADFEPKEPATLEPMLLSGLRSVDTEPASFVEAPADFEPKEPATLEPMLLSGLRSVDTEPASFVEAPADFDPKEPATLEPMSLSGLRAVDTEPASFVEAPADYEPKEPATLEPMSLSGLRSMDVEPAEFVEAPSFVESKEVTLSGLRSTDDGPVGFVEVPADFIGQEYTVEPVILSGLSHDRTTARFVEEPASYTPKEPVAFEPVALANLRDADDFAAFVEEPKSYVPKQPVALKPVSLSGLHMQDEISNVGFVEVPANFVGQEYKIESVSLKGLSKDDTFAGFVKEPAYIEKEHVDLEELAKPVSLSGLSALVDDFSPSVEEPASYKPREPVQFEPVSLSGLHATNETWGNVEEPEWYKPKEPVEVEPVQLSGIRSDETIDSRWVVPAENQERRSSLDQPLLDGEVDVLMKWREESGFTKDETDVNLVWRWREKSGFNTPMPRLEAFELCGVKATSSDVPAGSFQIVEDPYPSTQVEMPFESHPIDIMGLSEDPEARLKNHLNIGPLSGVPKFSLYEEPIELPEQVQEHVDLEQYRRAFPLSGIHTMEEGAIKNWLNTGALPGVNQEVSVYEAAGDSLPADYIEPRPKDDYDDVGRLAAGISNKKLKKPLKNWLNTKPLSYTKSSKLYQEAKPEPEPVEMNIDLDQFRAPFPLSGLTDDEIKHKNWLNNNHLPGVQSTSKSSYQQAGSSMPEDYIEPRDPSLEDDSKPLQGVNTSATELRLKNWLSATDLPGVQAGDRVYDEAKELSPSEYIQPPSEDQELPADFKLTGVVPHDDLPDLESQGLTPPKLHHDSEDEQSIATESTVPAPMSPTELKHKTSPSAQKLAMASGNWNAMSDITSLKEE